MAEQPQGAPDSSQHSPSKTQAEVRDGEGADESGKDLISPRSPMKQGGNKVADSGALDSNGEESKLNLPPIGQKHLHKSHQSAVKRGDPKRGSKEQDAPAKQ